MKSEVQLSELPKSKQTSSTSSSQEKPETNSSQYEIIKGILMYSFCSSSLLLLNKLVIARVPLHSYVSCVQFGFASLTVVVASSLGLIESIDFADYDKLKAYSVYVMIFITSLYSNFRALENGKIETIIVFRACTPLAVSMLDYLFLGRELPSRRSCISLLVIIFGACGYVFFDKDVSSQGLSAYSIWIPIWFCALCFTMTFGKMVLKYVKSSSTWDSVYYNNVIGFLPMFIFGTFVTGEWDKYQALDLGEDWNSTMLLLLMSSIVGTGIGYSGWKCRSLLAPASYTLVGVVNKLVTIIASMIITGQSVSWLGLACLVFAITGSAGYKQAPLRKQKLSEKAREEEREKEEVPLTKR